MIERISRITEKWFLSEEALFMAYCTHRLAENSGMKCPMRVGKGTIELNPTLCDEMNDKELEERLCVEVIRILLKHPYDRQPAGCSNTARALGSNCVIGDSYILTRMDIEHPEDFRLPPNGHYEFYARMIQKMLKQTEDSETGMESEGDASGDLAENWQQDELMAAQINETINSFCKKDNPSPNSSYY